MRTTAHRTTISAIAIAAALVMAPLLSGCGGIQGIIGEATGGAIQPSIGELPNEWPGEVPVVDGEVIGGNKASDPENADSTLWTAIIGRNDDVEGTKAEVTSSLEGAGFEAVNTEGAPVDALPFQNESYIVLVFVATGENDTVTATYNVTENTNTQE
jgi:hypothetical protein